ncbi:hypothetical protein GCM10027277_52150 [Pseudoduganella ginsengisoli]|uniref:DUF4214 domain-containing protein n=1 Tax=Pseudoduganella ginsengisoli TaxID=1462440 RepID=A0A6L6Q5M0_9BURK|nr:DUF4214 domain-containing protein [Pseudoduganella ginsengisoli]MTW04432.1 DUF4214 domain-containing protein [Pseudoduganella ginsengisoli]
MADDYSSSTNTLGRLAVGGKITGEFETSSDRDWFKIRLEQGFTYYFAMTGAEKGGGTLTSTSNGSAAALFIYDANGYMAQGLSRISPVTGNLPAMPFTPERTGDYFVEALGWNTGTYTITASAGPKDDYSDYYSDATSLALGSSKSGVIGTINDFDWYSSILTSGKLYELRVTGAPDVTFGRDIYTKGGNSYTLNVTGQTLTAAVEAGGIYYAAVTSPTGTGNYTVKLTELADDFPSNASTTGQLSAGGSASGRFEAANDIDWFKLDWAPGQVYQFSADAGATLVLKTIDAKGMISEDDIDPAYGYLAAPGVTAYLAVSGSQAGAYTVSLAPVQDDVGWNKFAPLGTQQAVDGRIDYLGDSDGYTLPVLAGHTYQLTLTAPPAGQYAIPYLQLDVVNPSVQWGGIMREISGTFRTDNATTISRSFKALEDGSVKALVSRNGETGQYTLTATDLGADDFGDSRASAAAVTVGSTTSGRIDADFDVDFIRYTLDAGVSYVFTTGGELAGKLAISGIGLPQYSSTAAIKQYVTPVVSGDYYFGLSSATKGNYTIQSALAADDYAGNASTSGKISVGGKVEGVLESTVDNDWFRVDLVAGKTYDISCPAGQPQLTVHDAQGNLLVTTPQFFDARMAIQYTPTTSAAYYIGVHSSIASGLIATSYSGSNPYTVAVAEGKPDDVAVPRTVALGAEVTGNNESESDVDQFLVTLDKGHVYKLALEAYERGSYGGFYGKLTIDRVAGNTVLESLGVTRSDSGAAYTFVADEAGVYRISLRSSTYSAQGYRFKVEDSGQKDDYANTQPLTPTIAPGDKLAGALDYQGDIDVFSIAVQAGQTMNVALYGAASGLGTLDTGAGLKFESLYGGFYAGNVPHLVFTSSTDTIIPIRVSGSNLGSYVLQVTDVSGDHRSPKLVKGLAGTFFSGSDIVLAFDEALMPAANRYGSFVVFDASGKVVTSAGADNSTQVRIADHTVSIKLPSTLPVGAGYYLSAPDSFATDLAGNAIHLLDGFTFDVVAAATSPGPGNDLYAGRHDGSRIDGGAGRDTVRYDGTAATHKVKAAGDGSFTVAYGNLPADTLVGIERLTFTGGGDALALDVDGTAGMAYRLYRAAFNRAPDQVGAGYWLAQMDQGKSLRDVAQSFLASDEFKARYGAAPTDEQFVASLYQNVLHRAGESTGVDYWNGVLHGGASRADVLVSFSESAENVTAVAAIIGNGYSYTPYS